MTISRRLEDLRKSIPGCRLVAFGDLEARLILKASHGSDVAREELDQLCAEGISCFSEAESIALTCQRQSLPREAIVLTSKDMHVFVAADTQSDFLIVVSPLSTDPDVPIAQCLQTLRSIEGNK